MNLIVKLFYKPFAIIAGLIAARLGQSVFKTLWSKIDEAPPPPPTTADATLPKVVAAASLQAATMAGVAAAADRASAKSFHYLFGIWPGPKREPAEADESKSG